MQQQVFKPDSVKEAILGYHPLAIQKEASDKFNKIFNQLEASTPGNAAIFFIAYLLVIPKWSAISADVLDDFNNPKT